MQSRDVIKRDRSVLLLNVYGESDQAGRLFWCVYVISSGGGIDIKK